MIVLPGGVTLRGCSKAFVAFITLIVTLVIIHHPHTHQQISYIWWHLGWQFEFSKLQWCYQRWCDFSRHEPLIVIVIVVVVIVVVNIVVSLLPSSSTLPQLQRYEKCSKGILPAVIVAADAVLFFIIEARGPGRYCYCCSSTPVTAIVVEATVIPISAIGAIFPYNDSSLRQTLPETPVLLKPLLIPLLIHPPKQPQTAKEAIATAMQLNNHHHQKQYKLLLLRLPQKNAALDTGTGIETRCTLLH